MPVTLKKGHIFYKNNSGTYTGLDVITDKATQQQIALIQNAKGYIFTQADQFIKNLKSSLPENFQTILENFSSTYIPENHQYTVGDYCTYEGVLYRCTAGTDGAFDPAHWEAVKVGSEFQNVDGQIDDLKSTLSEITGAYKAEFEYGAINLNSDPVNIDSGTGTTFVHCTIPCVTDDVFIVTASVTGGNYRIHAFLDSSYTRIPGSIGTINKTYSQEKLVAPENAAYLVVNTIKANPHSIIVGDTVSNRLTELKTDIEGELDTAVNGVQTDLDNTKALQKAVDATGIINGGQLSFVQGQISGDVIDYTNTKRIITANDITLEFDMILRMKSGSDYLYAVYKNENGAYSSLIGWSTGEKRIEAGTTFRIMIRNTNTNATVTVDKADELEYFLLYEKNIDYLYDANLVSIENRYRTISNQYIDADGNLQNGSNWRLRVYDASDIVMLKKMVCFGGSSFYAIAFYNSETISSETLMSGGKQYGSSSGWKTFENVDIPDGAVLIAITQSSSRDISIDALIKNTINIVDEKLKNLEGQYFVYNDIDLTENLKFTVPIGSEKYKNMIVSAYASYETTRNDDEYPTIQMKRRWYNSTGTAINTYYNSPKYAIGGKEHYTNKQWRFPPYMDKMEDYCTFTITVPEGVTLHIRTLANCYDNMIYRDAPGIRLNAHGLSGFSGPGQTLIQFEMSARLGYKNCITIPKVTSDGVYVCLHDDDSIQSTARNDDGTAIASEYQNIPVSGFTYAQLLQFDFGIYRGQPFKGERIPTVEDFFKICARTGMHPMFSVHPSLSTNDWENIKALAKKYGVLSMLNIKAPSGVSSGGVTRTNLTNAMQVFGNDIESYTIDVNQADMDPVSVMNSHVSTYSLDRNKVRLCIEFFETYATQSNINAVKNAGYDVSVAFTSFIMANMRTFIEMGVTEFTDDYVCSVGLNW